MSQISQESALLDQSQATLSNGHLSDEVDVDAARFEGILRSRQPHLQEEEFLCLSQVPLSGEIFSQRGSGAGSFLMDAESLTGEVPGLHSCMQLRNPVQTFLRRGLQP